MKSIMMVFLLVLSFNVYADFTRTYDVTGIDQDGNFLEGSAYENAGEDSLSGELIDENGDIHSYQGKWGGLGQIKGETDDGESVELRVR
jgi:hypothetical protein